MRHRSLSLASFLALSLAAAPALAAPTAPAAPVATAPAPTGAATPAPAPAAADDDARYAEAEQASPDAARFEGGASYVVIGVSTTALIVGVILLVLLL